MSEERAARGGGAAARGGAAGPGGGAAGGAGSSDGGAAARGHGARGRTRRALAYLARQPEAGLVAVVLLLGVVLTLAADPVTVRGHTVDNFLRADNLLANVATPMAWMAIMALGATLVIISGGIDISVGSVFGLSALGTAAALQHLGAGASGWLAIPLGIVVPLAIGTACGLINGALVVGLRLHPFIVTLGTLSIFRGIGLVAVETKTLPTLGRTLPDRFTEDFIGARATLGDVFVQPVPMLVMLLCIAAGWIYLVHTVGGREIYAVGGNEEAARFAGLRVGRVKLRVYALAGMLAGVAGMVSAGFYQSANTATGEGYELTVIAAAVVGGASLSGGRGTALGALLGALVIKLIENGIDIVRDVDLGFVTVPISKEHAKIIIGLAILVAVALDRLSERWRAG